MLMSLDPGLICENLNLNRWGLYNRVLVLISNVGYLSMCGHYTRVQSYTRDHTKSTK